MVPRAFAVLRSAKITRPADTTAYASGDLIANSTTAGSVTPFNLGNPQFSGGGVCRIKRIRCSKSGASVTNFAPRVHLFTAAPTVGAGDNAALAIATGAASYLGQVDLAAAQACTDGSVAYGTLDLMADGSALYALLEARGAYTPANAETFTIIAEVEQA
jgi:hypothetical protein